MTETTISAVTAPGFDFPAFLNATDLGDGTVRVTIRKNPERKDGYRVCAHSTSDPKYLVGLSCVAGGEGCNNYCNMHPNRRTKENPDGIRMADSPEPVSYTHCGETHSVILSRADWDEFIARAAAR